MTRNRATTRRQPVTSDIISARREGTTQWLRFVLSYIDTDYVGLESLGDHDDYEGPLAGITLRVL